MLDSLRHFFSRTQPSSSKRGARPPSVLAITPNYMDQLALRIVSSRKGWDLLVCPTLRSGLRTLRKSSTSVIVYDLGTKDVEWRHAIRLLLANGRPACLIGLTNAFDDELWEAALAYGVYDLQSRPLKDNLRLADAVVAAHELIASHQFPYSGFK